MSLQLLAGLTSIHRKYNSIQQKSLSYNSIHPVYGENACHTILPQFFFVLFINRNSNFVRKRTFSEKNLWMPNLIFCLHNVALVTIILAFFVSLKFFFSKMLIIATSFVWRAYVCLDQ